MLSLILSLALQSAGATLGQPAQASQEPPIDHWAEEPVELWQGLRTGMSPQEAATILSTIDSVKKVKVVNERKPNDPRRIDVSLTGPGYMVAGVAFEIGAIFKAGRLQQALIKSRELCASAFPEAYAPIRDGLIKKYGEPIFEQDQLDELEVLVALGDSSRLGQPVHKAVGFRSGSMAAYVDIKFTREERLARPYGMGKVMRALWEVADSEQRQRITACPGNSGLDRASIGIVYMHAGEMDAAITAANAAATKSNDETSDKL